MGAFPEPLTGDTVEPTPPSTIGVTTAPTTTTEPPPDPITTPIGDAIDGNRILLIGDTVLASTAPRHDGAMCDALTAFGWQGEIAAEFGRFVQFGREVADARLAAGSDAEPFDVVAIMLGNHFDGDVEAFRSELEALMVELDGRPTILYTLVEDDTFQADLNEIIRAFPDTFPNALVIDWAEIVADEPDVLVAESSSGLTEEGLRRLALFTVAALGEPPTIEGAGCVDPVFVDDSAIVL